MKRRILLALALVTLATGVDGQTPKSGAEPDQSASAKIAVRRAETQETLERCRLAIEQEEKSLAIAQERLRRLKERMLILEGAVTAFQEAETLASDGETPSGSSMQSSEGTSETLGR